MPTLSSYVSVFKKSYLFLSTAIRNAKNCISKKWHQLYLFFFCPLHSQIYIYCFEIWYVCCLYVGLQQFSGFLDNFKILVFIGIYFWKKRFLGVKIEKYQKPEIARL